MRRKTPPWTVMANLVGLGNWLCNRLYNVIIYKVPAQIDIYTLYIDVHKPLCIWI